MKLCKSAGSDRRIIVAEWRKNANALIAQSDAGKFTISINELEGNIVVGDALVGVLGLG